MVDHAEFQLVETMARAPDNVLSFLNSLQQKLVPLAEKELQKLLSLKEQEKKDRNEPCDGKINPWDLQYYSRILLESEYSIDEEKIKEYFAFENVTKGRKRSIM